MISLDRAFKSIRRKDFLRNDDARYADIDAPILIGYGQTNSQPSTVRQMLEWLDVQEGQKVLDVGSGSGWTTALLSSMVGPEGYVYAVEIVPELVEFGRENCRRAGVKNVEFYDARENYGLPKYAPYDRILVSAAADSLPTELIDQLVVGGRAVIPVRNDILVIDKIHGDEYETVRHSGYIFVPLVGRS
ncbi:MAG: methyltransferase domain-containing protein [Candidatus Saccharimonadaceae bacterium]